MGRVQADGFVVEARGPDAGWTTGRQRIEVMVRLPDGEALVEITPKVDLERWIVAGMVVPVSIDPRNPRKCDVLTDAIPPLAQRLADDDWTLCDLEEVAVLQQLARFSVGQLRFDGNHAELERRLRDEKAQRLAERPAEVQLTPSGRLRGTADLIAYEAEPDSRQHDTNPNNNLGWSGERLYRVWPFGRDPYAVRDKVRFPGRSSERARPLLAGGAVPIAVSPDSHSDVLFLWDEWEQARARHEATREHVFVTSRGGKLVVERRQP